MEFSINGTGIYWIQRIQAIWEISEAWIRVNLKILSLTYIVCLAGTVVASWSLRQVVVGSNPFIVMTNIFVIEFSENILGKPKYMIEPQ